MTPDDQVVLLEVLAQHGWDVAKLHEALPHHSWRTKQRAWHKINEPPLPEVAVTTVDVLRGILHVDPPKKKRPRTMAKKSDDGFPTVEDGFPTVEDLFVLDGLGPTVDFPAIELGPCPEIA